MQVESIRSLSATGAEALVVGMFPGRRPAAGTAAVIKPLGGWLSGALDTAEFTGGLGQVVAVPTAGGLPVGRLVVVGLGDDLDVETLRQAAGHGRKAVANASRLATTLHRVSLDGAVGAVLEGLALADYRFDQYRSDPKPHPELIVELITGGDGWQAAATKAAIITEAVLLCRDLVNQPPIDLAPLVLAQRLGDIAGGAGLMTEIWDSDRLAVERMGGILGVGAGSDRTPCLIKLHHRPARPKAKLALVGKGIVFDSGGLSIKTAEGMEDMKDDMGGAAAVLCAAVAIGRLGIPVEVEAYGALAENLPGGGAQRPGDVLTIRNGKTIEVRNTDAEGRLVLADGLSLAAEGSPDLIVDLATLTGACVVALGRKIAGVFGNNQTAIDRVLAAARSAGERVWPMPLPDDYRPLIDSDVADMKNTGGRYGGAITASILLAEFVGDIPWVHVDIAGPAYLDKPEHYLPKGGTGFGVRTLIELAEALAG